VEQRQKDKGRWIGVLQIIPLAYWVISALTAIPMLTTTVIKTYSIYNQGGMGARFFKTIAVEGDVWVTALSAIEKGIAACPAPGQGQ